MMIIVEPLLKIQTLKDFLLLLIFKFSYVDQVLKISHLIVEYLYQQGCLYINKHYEASLQENKSHHHSNSPPPVLKPRED